MAVASAKFTRRHLTSRVLAAALTECSNVAADFTGVRPDPSRLENRD